MRRRLSRFVPILAAAIAVAGPAHAQQVRADALTIRNIAVDLAAGTLTVAGARFGEAPQVTLNGDAATVEPGGTDARLVVRVPDGLLAAPGGYRLTVVNPATGSWDRFDVALAGLGLEVDRAGAPPPEPVPGTGAGSATSGADQPAVPAATGVLGAVRLPNTVVEDNGPPFRTALGFQSLLFNTTGNFNTAIGYQALYANSTGSTNTATGYYALNSNTNGESNTATGVHSLGANTSGMSNTANGVFSLGMNTTGSFNAAAGFWSLSTNSTGNLNAAFGMQALYANDTGSYNTAIGAAALVENVDGYRNTAAGYQAAAANTSGINNTAAGTEALRANTTGSLNTAIGSSALSLCEECSANTAVGHVALFNNMEGNYNTAAGYQALYANTSGANNTAVGVDALHDNVAGANNLALGYQAGYNQTTGSQNVYVANAGVAGESGIVRIGTTGTQTKMFLAGVRGVKLLLVNKALAVKIDKFGQLGTVVSSRRYKTDIHDMGSASDGLLRLRPVTFRYKGTDDPSRDYGLIAEEVAAVYPDLVVRNDAGQVETVQYDALPVLLLNEAQKQHRTISAQAAQIESLTREMAEMRARLAQLEVILAASRPGGTR